MVSVLVICVVDYRHILSGAYPALVLSSFKPVTVLKGKLKQYRWYSTSEVPCSVAFMSSVALIAGTLIVYRQLDFMMNQDLGMNIDQVLVVERPGIAAPDENAFNSAIDVFRNELMKNPSE